MQHTTHIHWPRVAVHKKQGRVSDSLPEPENQSPEIRVNFVFDICNVNCLTVPNLYDHIIVSEIAWIL